MSKAIIKNLKKLNKNESKLINKTVKENILKQKIQEKVPDKLQSILENAFIKAFETIFLKGSGIIEKTFNKDDLILEHDANNYNLERKTNNKNIKRLDKPAKKSNLINHSMTCATGVTLGLIGCGLPDIPLLVSTVLKGIYEVATSYGFDYQNEQEKIYILRLISVALSKGQQKIDLNDQLNERGCEGANLNDEIRKTAKIMSNELLVEKFVQGIPLIGVVGGITNFSTYRKISKLSVIKYKQRYLINQKMKGN